MATPTPISATLGTGSIARIGVPESPPPPPPPPAPSLILSAASPASGQVGVQSSDITVGWSNLPAATTIIPSVAPGPGTITPSSIAAGPGNGSAALRLTPLAALVHTISLANNGGITNPSPLVYTATPAPAPTPPPPPPPPSGGAQAFSLYSATTRTGAPFCCGFAFKAGHIPSGQSVTSNHGTLQVDVKNRWADGSIRFALLSGTADITAGTPRVITLSAGSAAGGTALTLTDLKNTGITASIAAGAFGNATWAGTDWDTPFMSWASGPRMSSWIYRKQISSDTHLVAWLEIRLFAGGAVEVLPWIENGYLTVTGPTNKGANYTFSLGGTTRNGGGSGQVIDLPHHSRTPLVSGSALSYWLGTDPGVSVKHDVAYMQATEVVPTYGAVIGASNSQVTGLPGTYTALQQGSYTYGSDIMSGTGFAAPIGLLPQHDELYLTTDADIGATVQRNAYSAGRYPIHWRDQATNRPPAFATYPTLAIGPGQGITNTVNGSHTPRTPDVSGTAPPQWDLAHCPSVGYMAYLLTGRPYHLETAQFAAIANHFHQDPTIRANGSGVMRSYPGANDTRHTAWGLRTLWQALSITPDDDTAVRPSLKASLQATIDFHHARYVAQANNPLGFTEPGSDYLATAGVIGDRLFMQDFSVASWGYLLAALPALDSGYAAKVAAFMVWHGKATIGRLGDPADANAWEYMNAATYNGAVAASDSPDWANGTGPWFSTFKAARDATYATPPGWLGSDTTYLAGEAAPSENSPGDSVRSFWGNLQPAISYCVRHGLTGARAAYQRMLAARNAVFLFEELQLASVWGVVPASGWAPAWLASQSVGAFKNIAGTSMAGSAIAPSETPGDEFGESARRTMAYVGLAIRQLTGEAYIGLDSGHNDGSTNSTRKLTLFADAPAWSEVNASTPSGQRVAEQPYYTDGKPAGQHTNWSHRIHEKTLRGARLINRYSRNVFGGPAPSFPDSNGLALSTGAWDAANTWADATFLTRGTDPLTGKHYGQPNNSPVFSWNPDTDTETQQFTTSGLNPMGAPWCYHPTTRQMFALCWGDGQASGSGVTAYLVGASSRTPITFNASSAYTQFQSDGPAYASMEWDWFKRVFYFYEAKEGREQRVFVIRPNSGTAWDMEVLTLHSSSDTPAYGASTLAGALCNKFQFVPALRGCFHLGRGSQPTAFLRTF